MTIGDLHGGRVARCGESKGREGDRHRSVRGGGVPRATALHTRPCLLVVADQSVLDTVDRSAMSHQLVPHFIHCPPFLHIYSVLSISRLLCALQFLREWMFVLGVDFGCSFVGVLQGDG